MTMGSKTVPLVNLNGQPMGDGEVSYHAEDGHCILRLRNGQTDVTATASDYFEALCEVRLMLETKGILVATYGGSRTVFPSGMARDMGAGLKAYRLTLGSKGRREDLVGIFDTGPGVEPATVEAQRAFFREWASTIGGAPSPGAG
jgi:hypothetical protein